MKKLIALFTTIIFLASCSYLPVTRGYLEKRLQEYPVEVKGDFITKEQAQQIWDKLNENLEASKESLEMMSRFNELLENTSANKIRAFTDIEGGGSGAMDAISCENLATNDLGFANDIGLDTIGFYRYVSTDTTAEDTTNNTVIKPDNVDVTCSGNGRWLLFSSFTFAGTTTPSVNLKDSDQSHQTVAKIYANANDANDSYLYFQVEVGTSLSTFLTMDGVLEIITAAYGLQAPMAMDTSSGAESLAATDMNKIIVSTGAGDRVLPDVCDSATGQWIMILNNAAHLTSVDVTDSSDDFKLSDGTNVDGDANEVDIDSSQAWAFGVFTCVAANTWMVTGENGAGVTDGGADD